MLEISHGHFFPQDFCLLKASLFHSALDLGVGGCWRCGGGQAAAGTGLQRSLSAPLLGRFAELHMASSGLWRSWGVHGPTETFEHHEDTLKETVTEEPPRA